MYNTTSHQPNGTGEAKPFQPPTGPRFGKKQNKASNPLKATAPAFIPMPASSSVSPNPSKPFNPSVAAFQPSWAPQTAPANPQHQQQPAKRETSYFPPVVASGTTTPMNHSWYGLSSTPQISPMTNPMSMSTPGPTYTPRNPRKPPITPAKPPGEPLCQAIAHYHSCGCRAASSPTFICSVRRCKHDRPTRLVVGYLSFPCTARWSGNRKPTRGPEGTPGAEGGRGPACRERDPGTIGFQREEGTASRSPGNRSFNGDTLTLDDLPETLPSDTKGVEGFEAWVGELKVKSEARAKDLEKEKEDRKKPAVCDMGTQTEWPQTVLDDVGTQTNAPPQPVMRSTGVQSSGPEQKEIAVQTNSPAATTSTGMQPSGPEQKEVAVQTNSPAATTSTGTQSSGPEKLEMATQTELPPPMSRCVQWKESDVGVSDGSRRCEEHFLKQYGTPCHYCDTGADSDEDDAEYEAAGRVPFDLLLDLDYARVEDDELYYGNDAKASPRKTAAPSSGESRGVLRNAWKLVHWII